jgi:hypothetical protein
MLIVLAAVAAMPAAAQQTQQTPPEAGWGEPRNPEVLVQGYRARKKSAPIATGSLRQSPVQNRHRLTRARMFADCSARGRLAPVARLGAVIDAVVGSAAQAFAQDRLKRTHAPCSAEGGALLSVSTAAGADGLDQLVSATAGGTGALSVSDAAVHNDPAALGRSLFDRGALTIAALKRFAPDLVLTRRETHDPAVQQRFNAREIPRNRLRTGGDRLFFEVAVCMVRLEPELAVSLALNDQRELASDLQGALIDGARDCVGGARQVAVDPSHMRMYIADAVYRWAVAARGVDTLIPKNS